MRIVLLFLVLFALLIPCRNLYAFATKGQDCSKCHTLKKDEASSILKDFDQNIKVLTVATSQVGYLWEISYESKGKKGIVYIDMPKKHIFSGTLLSIRGKENLTEDSLSKLKKVNVSQIPLKDALILGSKGAKHRIIVFDDPE